MYEDRAQKILLGNSIELPEQDLDDAMVKSEYGRPVEEEALKEFYFITVTDNIGKEDFKENYLSAINIIRTDYDVEKQKMLCDSIFKQIKEVYDYLPPENVDYDTENEILDVYEFLQFLEFDHEEFIVGIWGFFKPETNLESFENYCEQNGNKIIYEIEEQIDSKVFP